MKKLGLRTIRIPTHATAPFRLVVLYYFDVRAGMFYKALINAQLFIYAEIILVLPERVNPQFSVHDEVCRWTCLKQTSHQCNQRNSLASDYCYSREQTHSPTMHLNRRRHHFLKYLREHGCSKRTQLALKTNTSVQLQAAAVFLCQKNNNNSHKHQWEQVANQQKKKTKVRKTQQQKQPNVTTRELDHNMLHRTKHVGSVSSKDIVHLLSSMASGANRIRAQVLKLRRSERPRESLHTFVSKE